MCGFAGVLSFNPHCRLDGDIGHRLGSMFSCDLAHRGPDGEGTFRLGFEGSDPPTPDRPRALIVHRRLAVLDPQPRSDQPYTGCDGRLVLAYNGEIFNFRQLRDELSPRQWRTEGDTEVLLAAYEKWGEQCCERFEGMFAFAILDLRQPGQPRLFVARDPAGEKPLYLALGRREPPVDGDDPAGAGDVCGVAFSSELAPLRRAAATIGWVDLATDLRSLQAYLAWGYVPGQQSIHRGIFKLLPGHCMTITPGGVVRRRYFDAGGRFQLDPPDRWASAITATRKLVAAAVGRRLVSDVPIGCLLSGGIDSSVVALQMSRQAGKIDTFSVGFDDDPRYDESPYARRVADHLGTRHHELRISVEAIDVAGDLPKLAEVFGEPFADSSAIPTHLLAKFARERVTVALGGDGGDEIFGGYDRYRALMLSERIATMPMAGAALGMAQLMSQVLSRLPAGHAKSHRARLGRLLKSLSLPVAERYASYVRVFTYKQLQGLMPPGVAVHEDPGRVAGRWFDAYVTGRDLVAAAASLDRATYLPGDLLVKLDRCSMRYGLEMRSPFVDRDLLRFAGTLGEAGLMERGRGKVLLRDAFGAALPAEVFERRKMGFAVPVSQWLRGKLSPMVRELVFSSDSFASAHFDERATWTIFDRHLTGRRDNGHQLYALLMLELWWRQAREDIQNSSYAP